MMAVVSRRYDPWAIDDGWWGRRRRRGDGGLNVNEGAREGSLSY